MTTTDSTLLALLQAVLTHPAEDMPRLAYADRLDEIGGEVVCPKCDEGTPLIAPDNFAAIVQQNAGRTLGRLGEKLDSLRCVACHGTGRVSDGRRGRAEFIRVQVELAGYEEKVTDDARAEHWWNLRRRERVLRDAHGDQWRLEATGNLGVPLTGETGFSRGFVSSLTLSAADWLLVADVVFWSPGQTVACQACHGNGEYVYGLKEQQDWCRVCDGTGRFPRPFVATAQPITQVVLSDGIAGMGRLGLTPTLPDGVWFDGHTPCRWPGVTFHMQGAT